VSSLHPPCARPTCGQPPPAASAFPHFLTRRDLACNPTTAERFYPKAGESHARGIALCLRCPARGDCLQWALQTRQQHGVWGGTTPEQRAQLTAPARFRSIAA
jgi:WhiB family transcriptional regulator, redox-sensing transcriptional regulator